MNARTVEPVEEDRFRRPVVPGSQGARYGQDTFSANGASSVRPEAGTEGNIDCGTKRESHKDVHELAIIVKIPERCSRTGGDNRLNAIEHFIFKTICLAR